MLTLKGVGEARKNFIAGEPRNLFYLVATELIDLSRNEITKKVSVAQALAVLLQTWNVSFYRFRVQGKFRQEDLTKIDALLRDHSALNPSLLPACVVPVFTRCNLPGETTSLRFGVTAPILAAVRKECVDFLMGAIDKCHRGRIGAFGQRIDSGGLHQRDSLIGLAVHLESAHISFKDVPIALQPSEFVWAHL